jgi:hypothetical protein
LREWPFLELEIRRSGTRDVDIYHLYQNSDTFVIYIRDIWRNIEIFSEHIAAVHSMVEFEDLRDFHSCEY